MECDAKVVGRSQSVASKIWSKYKQNRNVVKRETYKVDHGRHQSVTTRKLKAVCLGKRKYTTKEMGFTSRKAKCKLSLTPKWKKARLQWPKERQSWTVDDWMRVIISGES